MKGTQIGRVCDPTPLSLTLETGSTTPEIDMRDFAGGSVSIPAASSITTMTYYGCHTKAGTHLALLDAEGAAVTQTVAASRVINMPTSVYGLPYMSIRVNAQGAVTVSRKG